MRIDKWLWAARFFKTRSLAERACELGRIESNEVRAKPSREVRIDASREMRMKVAEERKAMPHFEATREGKPSKRDRRELGRLRGRV